MPPRQREPHEFSQQIVPLLLLGIGLVSTLNAMPFLDREAAILGVTANPIRPMLGEFLSGSAHVGQPPLYGVVLNLWLHSAGGGFEYLRALSVILFLGGLFLLGRAGRHLGGSSAGATVVWMGALWPLGFHYGRLASSDSFSFFVVAGLTLSYFNFLESQTPRRWAAFTLFCIALVWTSYLGWAVLSCLAVDQMLRFLGKETSARPKVLVGTVGLVCVFFVPLFAAFRSDFLSAMNFHQPARSIVVGAAVHIYSLFVSESVAPWYWRFSAPAALALAIFAGLAVWLIPRTSRRFLYYGAALIVLMAAAGILQTKDAFMIAPWFLLPSAMAIDAAKPRWANFVLAAALLTVAGIGWYGVYSRRYYSALEFVEPWQDVAIDATGKIASGATVIADTPAFFLYLTNDLRVPKENGPWRFEGLLPDGVKHPQVFSSVGWLVAGHPIAGKMILVRTGQIAGENEPADQAARQLDQSCGSISSRLRVRDEGYSFKQRFFPQVREPQWRIEVREYDCNESNSKQIYRIPPSSP